MKNIIMSRREFAQRAAALAATAGLNPLGVFAGVTVQSGVPLSEFGYGDVSLDSELHESQLKNTHEVLMNMSEDSLLRPFRQMAGQPAPGADLGGWYNYDPDFDWHKSDDAFAPGATFGQWVSALARYYAISGSTDTRDKVLRLNRLYAKTISEDFYDKNRFPAYCYDKLLLGLIDSHQYVGDADAFAMLERTTQAALPHMPGKAIDRELEWRAGKDQSYRWDESYTNPENLFLAYQRGAGTRYRDIGVQYLDDETWFDPLARGENVLGAKHAYSYVNSFSSALQAYMTLGSDKHLKAAKNGFAMLEAQSFATGGWGPDEMLEAPGSGKVLASLEKTHNSFETPCGAYAHFKAARYLLRTSGDSRYGDSMERVMYNTVLGVKPMQSDGHAFYYADYNVTAKKVYSNHRFPCCSGTLPQVAADYRINTYLRDRDSVYVNLYIPSTVRWTHRGVQCTLQQHGDYPFEDHVTLKVSASQPTEFALKLRIPAWADGARLQVNGSRWHETPTPGTFASIRREWRAGDEVVVVLPRTLRLQPIDAAHAGIVALLQGPLVLFPLHDNGTAPAVTRTELLATRQVARQAWTTRTSQRTVSFLPYVAIGEQPYSTYLKLA